MDLDREFTKGWNVETLRYYSSATHKMIGIESHNGQAELDSIGENGRNLTFAVLSMNRADNTIRLMRSIAEQMPEFPVVHRNVIPLVHQSGGNRHQFADIGSVSYTHLTLPTICSV